MKKTKFLRLASVMLMLCLITTCAISGTFAKYVTTASSGDAARVAKWGMQIELLRAETNGFDNVYAKDADASFNVTGNTVISNYTNPSPEYPPETGHDNVLAPGTDGELAHIVITGVPEVATRLTVEVNLDFNENWKDSTSALYCPLVFTVTDGTNTSEFKIDATNDTLAKLEAAVEKEIVDMLLVTPNVTTPSPEETTGVRDYVPNTDFTATAIKDVTVSWSWAFETGATPAEKDANNVKDTYLGDQAANNIFADVLFNIDIVAEQID